MWTLRQPTCGHAVNLLRGQDKEEAHVGELALGLSFLRRPQANGHLISLYWVERWTPPDQLKGLNAYLDLYQNRYVYVFAYVVFMATPSLDGSF